MQIQLTSSAFHEGEMIPVKYTCDGINVSPSLSWSLLPTGTKSLGLIADDPDAPVGTWVHWVIYDVPFHLSGLPEGVSKNPVIEGLGVQGTNDFHRSGYDGPCPPRGSPHRYYFKLYALDCLLNLKPGATKQKVEQAMQGHILGQGQLMGKYQRRS